MVIKFPSKILVLFILLATLLIGFTYVIRKDAGKIVHKTLHDYDESTDSVVSANLSRSLFPAMLRLNSLVDKAYETDGWLFNAYWQHRPPLYTYIPVPFFIVQGRPSIETERLSFALVNFLTACVFIVAVFLFTGDAIPAVIATIAALIWIHGPFTRALVNGDWFGVSDIVLTFMTTCCLAVLLWYLSQELSKRTVQSWQRLFFYGIVMSLPILTKNLLGMIPAATFFLIFLCDHWWVSRRSGTIRPLILTPFISFFMLLFLYYGSLFLSSPETFKIEFPVALLHIWKNYEGWGRPWNWFIVNYLPLNYGIKKTLLLLLGGINLILFILRKRLKKKETVLFFITSGWFWWNLTAVSIITSKCPNFMFQSYLFFIFSVLYGSILIIHKTMAYFLTLPTIPHVKRLLTGILIFLCILAGINISSARKAIISAECSYHYTTVNERCYLLAERARLTGWDWRDLILLKTNLNDYWFPYYFMFLTGSEARTLDHFLYIANSQPRTQFLQRLKEKYRRIIIIVKEQLIPGMPFLVGKTEDIRLSEILPSTRIILLAPKEYDSFFSNVRSN